MRPLSHSEWPVLLQIQTLLLLPVTGVSRADRSPDYKSVLNKIIAVSNNVSLGRGVHGKQAGAGHSVPKAAEHMDFLLLLDIFSADHSLNV